MVFGLSKALSNYLSGKLASRFGRRKILIMGWLLGLPVPLILWWANDWTWVLVANVLLGIQQGLCQSSTVMMKIDLVGEKQRGLAMGLNEFAGYLAVGGAAWLSAYPAAQPGLADSPFIMAWCFGVAGLLPSWWLVRDTEGHVLHEASRRKDVPAKGISRRTSFSDPTLASVTRAGLLNNLNNGMIWGLLPLLLSRKGFSMAQIGLVAAVYPAVWGLGQLITGPLSDRVCKKKLMSAGMALQGLALLGMIRAESLPAYVILAALLGAGTAMVYPTFLATVAEYTHPPERAESLGSFRLWRDLGYAIGAVSTGIIADLAGLPATLLAVAILTLLSGYWIERRMHCKRKTRMPA